MPERIAISLAAWQLPLEDALDRAHALGANAVDLIAIPGWGQLDPAAVARDPDSWIRRVGGALRRRGLTCSGINAALPDPHRAQAPARARAALAQAEGLARLCAGLGAGVVSLYPGYVHPGTPTPNGLAGTCRQWLAIGRRHGVVLAPEVHWCTALPTPQAALALLAEVPGLRLILDPSHQAVADLPLADWRPLLTRVAHVHWRDAAPGRLQVPWGSGGVVGCDLLGELQRAGYRGWIVAEALPESADDLPAILAALRAPAAVVA